MRVRLLLSAQAACRRRRLTEIQAITWVELLTVAAVAAWNLATTPAAWKPRP